MENKQSANQSMRRRTDEQERRTKAQIRPGKKSKRGDGLECDRCGRMLTNEQTLKYHIVMCNKTKTLGTGERRTVKDFFPSDEDDDSTNLLFFTEKNLELTSRSEVIERVERELGVPVREFLGKEKVAPGGTVHDDPDQKRKGRRRGKSSLARTNPKKQNVSGQKKDGNEVKCDCCGPKRKTWEATENKIKKSKRCEDAGSDSDSPCPSSSTSSSSSSSSNCSTSEDEEGGPCQPKKDFLTVDVKTSHLSGTNYFKDNYYILPFHQNQYKSM